MKPDDGRGVYARTMQHVYIAVEALGPPGRGTIFALGATRFTSKGLASCFSVHIKPLGPCDPERLAFLSRQDSDVLAQLRGGLDFSVAWYDFQTWLFGETRAHAPTTFWADGWADFAWLDIECARWHLPSLFQLGPYLHTSSGLSALVPAQQRPLDLSWGRTEGYVPFVAVDDATVGALNLLAALRALGCALPG